MNIIILVSATMTFYSLMAGKSQMNTYIPLATGKCCFFAIPHQAFQATYLYLFVNKHYVLFVNVFMTMEWQEKGVNVCEDPGTVVAGQLNIPAYLKSEISHQMTQTIMLYFDTYIEPFIESVNT